MTEPTPIPAPPARRGVLADYRALTPSERSLWRFPLMWAAAIAILFIPLLYAGIYLASVWDPYGRLQDLPVALVNADAGTTARGERYDLGRDLVEKLEGDPPVKFVDYPTEAAAQDAVRRGDVYFALTIPRDFSQKAVAGSSAEHGRLLLYTAPGTSYFASRVGASVAREIATNLNETLGSNRWEVVQASLKDVQQGFRDIRDATRKLRDGAATLQNGAGDLATGAADLADGARTARDGGRQLTAGARTLSTNVSKLTTGTTRLSDGLRRIEVAAPGQKELRPLQNGARRLQDGATRLAGGLGQLRTGAAQLSGGATDLARGAAAANGGAQQLAKKLPALAGGLGQLQTGATQLSNGATDLAAGSAKLSSGAADLSAKLPGLQSGLGQLAGGADRLSAGADDLAGGATRANTGAARLAAGTARLRDGAATAATGAQEANAAAAKLAANERALADAVKDQPLPPTFRDNVAALAFGAEQLAQGTAALPDGLARLRQGAADAATGAAQLAEGTAQLQTGATQLRTGAASLAENTRFAARGAETAVEGAGRLAAGARDATAGAQKLRTGAATLAGRTGEAAAGARTAVSGAAQLAEGTARLQTGAAALRTGAATLANRTGDAATGATDLAKGARDLNAGVDRVVAGNVRLKDALGTVTKQLPAQRDLDRLSGGAATLAEKSGDLADGLGKLTGGADRLADGAADLRGGAGKLRDGLNELYTKIPVRTEQLGGDPEGLSASVTVVEQDTAAVPNNGSAFAPYFMALALWVGGTLTTFIFPYLLLPESGRGTGQLARVLRKFTVPAGYVVVQALLVVLGLRLLGVTYLSPGLVALTAIGASLTFMLLILALNLLLGAAGRLLALVLLVVQLGASGGSYPVELSPGFFRAIHAVIPVTDVIDALRFAMFGSYEGQYGMFMGRMLLVALASFAVALLSRRRWQFAPDGRFRSPIITDVG